MLCGEAIVVDIPGMEPEDQADQDSQAWAAVGAVAAYEHSCLDMCRSVVAAVALVGSSDSCKRLQFKQFEFINCLSRAACLYERKQ